MRAERQGEAIQFSTSPALRITPSRWQGDSIVDFIDVYTWVEVCDEHFGLPRNRGLEDGRLETTLRTMRVEAASPSHQEPPVHRH